MEAEGIYSRERLRALADEWHGLYPNLLHLVDVLKRRREMFTLEEVTEKQLTDNYLELLVSGRGENGLDLDYMKAALDGAISLEDYKTQLLLIFYKTGLVGIKVDSFSQLTWSDSGVISISKAEIRMKSKIYIHPMFWRCLGVNFREDVDDNTPFVA